MEKRELIQFYNFIHKTEQTIFFFVFIYFSYLISFIYRLFETNEDLKGMFSAFKELKNAQELRESRALENHAMMVMCTIDEALTNLDDMDYVIDLLKKIGRTHTRFENYKPEIFWVRE